MNKTIKFYGLLFLIILLILGLIIGSKKEITDWSKNFEVDNKSPFGLYVFNQEAENLFKHKLIKSHQSPYLYYENKKKPHNILFIEHHTDRESWNKILDQVSKGSDLMYISDSQHSMLTDTIERLKPVYIYSVEDYGIATLTDKKRNHKIELDKMPSLVGFKQIPKNAEMLGLFLGEEEDELMSNFVKIPFGKGFIYYHSEPLFLTNYHLLKNNDYLYAQDVLSYLKDRETVWFMEEIDNNDLVKSGHPLGFVFKKPPLKYAWWTFLAGLLFLMIFKAKRTQRIIPIMTSKKNKSLEFVKNIGNLYLQEGNIRDMMKKKTMYFLYHLRTELFIPTQDLNENFIKTLQVKTGANREEIEELIGLINKSEQEKIKLAKEDLMKLDKLIDNILKK